MIVPYEFNQRVLLNKAVSAVYDFRSQKGQTQIKAVKMLLKAFFWRMKISKA